ncbi:MAG: hypothetical protein M3Y21_08140 [Candidatus Eremiobacteraeota bacterium]|nr:hypothetical protein [Candidatus Eremiobacteraeota bacterium]
MFQRQLLIGTIAAAVFCASIPGISVAQSSGLTDALKNYSSEVDKLRSQMGNTTASQIMFVNAAPLSAQAQTELAKHKSDESGLRESLAAMTVTDKNNDVMNLSDLFKAKGLTVSQVIAVHVAAGGAVTLYYK